MLNRNIIKIKLKIASSNCKLVGIISYLLERPLRNIHSLLNKVSKVKLFSIPYK